MYGEWLRFIRFFFFSFLANPVFIALQMFNRSGRFLGKRFFPFLCWDTVKRESLDSIFKMLPISKLHWRLGCITVWPCSLFILIVLYFLTLLKCGSIRRSIWWELHTIFILPLKLFLKCRHTFLVLRFKLDWTVNHSEFANKLFFLVIYWAVISLSGYSFRHWSYDRLRLLVWLYFFR